MNKNKEEIIKLSEQTYIGVFVKILSIDGYSCQFYVGDSVQPVELYPVLRFILNNCDMSYKKEYSYRNRLIDVTSTFDVYADYVCDNFLEELNKIMETCRKNHLGSGYSDYESFFEMRSVEINKLISRSKKFLITIIDSNKDYYFRTRCNINYKTFLESNL